MGIRIIWILSIAAFVMAAFWWFLIMREKPYYEVIFKQNNEWGFTCGYCGRVVDSKHDLSYWKLREFSFVNDAFNLACSERCAKALLKEHMWDDIH